MGFFSWLAEKAFGNKRASESSFGISPTPELTRAERDKNKRMVELTEQWLRECNLIIPEKVPEMMEKLMGGHKSFDRVPNAKALEGETALTVEEKKKLGLNTRMKYTHAFLNFFAAEKLKGSEPKSTISCIILNAFHKASREADIKLFRAQGFIKQVKIECDSDACTQVHRLKKIHGLESVPDLPLPGCKEDFCRCYLSPIIK